MAICVVLRWWIGFYEFETKRPCKPITGGTKLFSLVHNNLDDLKHTMTRDGKRFYVIFVDNHSIFYLILYIRNRRCGIGNFYKI